MQKRWVVLWSLLSLLWVSGLWLPAHAETLQERLVQFPHWQAAPILQTARGDLYYPDWMAGDWQVTSTLIDCIAPLAPALITPGFTASQKTLGQSIPFEVRFQSVSAGSQFFSPSPFPTGTVGAARVVADRAYNGMNLAAALLGQDAVQSIQVDPRSPNHQVARFENGYTLVTDISDRGSETPSATEFISSELYQQSFESATQIYLNRVENTIAYHLVEGNPPLIEADQVTAIYLSPQDPDYFKAGRQPVALYRYRLQFKPALN